MKDRARYWDEVYGSKATDEVSWFQLTPTTSLEVIDELAPDPSAGALDVGGGASPLVGALLSRAWRDLAVLDLSAKALAANRAGLGPRGAEVDWIVGDVTTWRPSRRYGLWHDRAALHFLVDEEDQAAYARTLASAIAPGGSVVIATFAPDGPTSCSGLPVARHDAASICSLLGGGFTLVLERMVTHLTPSGLEQRFCWVGLRAEGAS